MTNPLTCTLGGHTLALPESYDVATELIAAQDRMGDGTLQVDLIAEKHKITINWTGLSKAERDNLRLKYDDHIAETPTLALPDGRTFTVAPAASAFQEPQPFFDTKAGAWYSVTIVFVEV